MNCGKTCSETFRPRKPALKSETESELRPPLASLRSLVARNLIRTADTVSRAAATETPKPNPNRGLADRPAGSVSQAVVRTACWQSLVLCQPPLPASLLVALRPSPRGGFCDRAPGPVAPSNTKHFSLRRRWAKHRDLLKKLLSQAGHRPLPSTNALYHRPMP